MCFRGRKGFNVWGNLMNTCYKDGHTMQSEPMRNKDNESDFSWQCSMQVDALLLDLKMWGCEGEVAAWYYQRREYMKSANKELGPRAILWTLCQVLLKLPVYMSLLTPYYDVSQFGGFAILKNKRATNCQNFYFPWHDEWILFFQ